MSTTKKAFRIEVAQPEQVKSIEQNASSDLKTHFNLIKKGLTQLPGVPEEAIYGAVTLRALALKPEIFSAWFLTEYHSVKNGEIDSKYKEILAYLISERNEGGIFEACTPYHFAAAKFEGATETEIIAIKESIYNNDEINDIGISIIKFGLDVVFNPEKITDNQISVLQENGISDAGLIELISAALIANNLSIVNKVFQLKEGVI